VFLDEPSRQSAGAGRCEWWPPEPDGEPIGGVDAGEAESDEAAKRSDYGRASSNALSETNCG
jgi:hypothetical protein